MSSSSSKMDSTNSRHIECPICYQDMKDPVLVHPCHHIFCSVCIMAHRDSSSQPLCPCCNVKISKTFYSAPQLTAIVDQYARELPRINFRRITGHSGKGPTLRYNLLEDRAGVVPIPPEDVPKEHLEAYRKKLKKESNKRAYLKLKAKREASRMVGQEEASTSAAASTPPSSPQVPTEVASSASLGKPQDPAEARRAACAAAAASRVVDKQ